MTGLTHLLVGGALVGGAASGAAKRLSLMGLSGRRLWVGAVLAAAFFSHFVLDFLPHDDYIYFYLNNWTVVYTSLLNIILLIIGAGLLFFLVRGKTARAQIFCGAFFAALPDILTGGRELLGWPENLFDRLHYFFHVRFDLGELFYTRLAGGSLAVDSGSYWAWLENWQRIRVTFWGNLGWGIEAALEVLVILAAAKYLRGLAGAEGDGD